MKTFAVFLIVAIVGCQAEVETEGLKQKVKAADEKCQSDPATALDSAALKAFREKTGPRPENMGPHALCLAKALKLQNEDGSINTAFIKEKFEEYASAWNGKTVDDVLSECAVKKENDIATAEHLLRCLIFERVKLQH